MRLPLLREPPTNESTAITRKTKNSILATPTKEPAIPPKPSNAAINAIMRHVMANCNMTNLSSKKRGPYEFKTILDCLGFPGNLFHGVLYRVRYVLDHFLDFANSLVGFAFLTKFFTANQNTCGLFDSTFILSVLPLIALTPVPSKLVNQTNAHCICLPKLNMHRQCQ